MFVFVVGGGKTGSQLTRLLLEQGHKVRLIENRGGVLEALHREIPSEVILTGDGTDPAVLQSAGIQQAQVLIAVMRNDEDNLVTCLLARREFKVPRVIARVNDPANAWLFTPEMGVDVALNQAEIFSSLIEEEMSLGDMMTLLKIRRGKYSLVEEKLPPDARAVGMAIKDLPLPDECVIAAIIRKGEIVIPRGVTTLEAGDEVLAVVNRPAADELALLFGRQQSR